MPGLPSSWSRLIRWCLRRAQPTLLLLLVVLLAAALFTGTLQSSWHGGQWAAPVGARSVHQASTAAETATEHTAPREDDSAVAATAADNELTPPRGDAPPPKREKKEKKRENPSPPKENAILAIEHGEAVAAEVETRRKPLPPPPRDSPGVTEPALPEDPSPSTPPTESEVAERMRRRSERIRQVCKRNPKYVAPGITTNIFYDQTHSMVWCPIFKAGSTNWLRLLCQVHKLSSPCPIEVLRRHMGNVPHFWKIPQTVTHRFLVVRHPLERLLSAYRDKIEDKGCRPGKPYWSKALKMIKLHRRHDDPPAQGSGPGDASARALVQKAGPPAPLTFPEFLRSVAQQDVGDEHWKPYFAFCTPCNVHYDLIGKFETLEEDNQYIASQLGIDDYTELLRPELANRNKRGPTGSRAKQYFSQVTQDELMQVYKMFHMDFVMFNYTISDYLEYVRPNDGPDEDTRRGINDL